MANNSISLISKLLLFTLIFLCSHSIFAHLNECKTPLRLSSTSEWYPYIYQNDNGESTGVDVELLRYVLGQMGCELTIIHFPERRALFELSQGHFDVGLGASKTAKRQQDFFYTSAYRNEKNKFVYRSEEIDIATMESLQDIFELKKIVAINLAGWYGDEIEQAKADYNLFIFSDTVSKRLKMLHLKRVDIVVDDDIVLCSELQRTFDNKLTIHPMVLSQTSIHFIFNKTSVSSSFVEQFNKILNAMRDDGSLLKYFYQHLPSQCFKTTAAVF